MFETTRAGLNGRMDDVGKLFDSIPRRIEAVQMAGGEPSPY